MPPAPAAAKPSLFRQTPRHRQHARVAAPRLIRHGVATAAMRRTQPARAARQQPARVITILRRLLQVRPQLTPAVVVRRRNIKQRHAARVIRLKTAVALPKSARAARAQVTLMWQTAARREIKVGKVRRREIIPVRRHAINARRDRATAVTARQHAVAADQPDVTVGRVRPQQRVTTGKIHATAQRVRN
jgi:hypothetical protein